MLTRILTGIVGISLTAFIVQQGGILFSIFALLLSLIAWYEYCKAFSQKGINLSLVVGAIMVCITVLAGWTGEVEVLLGTVMLSTLLMLLMPVFRHTKNTALSAIVSATGIMYIGLPFAHMVMLRYIGATKYISTSLGDFQLGCALIWVAFIGTWASDTFAYFTGCAFGKHKLCPTISPKKTMEGFVGGLVGTSLSVAGLGVFFGFNTPVMAILGVWICLIATLGDLVESVMKRYTGIKDSGNIIPGHGGVWDRFDSMLYTIPLVYYFFQIFGING